MRLLLKKYWFFAGLFLVFCITIGDYSGITASCGSWLKVHWGPNISMILIFLTSGLLVHIDKIREGIKDVKGTSVAFLIILVAAPLLALVFMSFPMDPGIIIGILIVSAMPTTLSSGVVMTGASGGNMAHALLITILSSFIGVVSVPIILSWQLSLMGSEVLVSIDKTQLMAKIGFFVIVPLCIGLFIRRFIEPSIVKNSFKLQMFNQLLILVVVWMALSDARAAIINGGEYIPLLVGCVSLFHIFLVIAALVAAKIFKLGRGRRESVIFMGGQKTLALSILIQVAVFPEFPIALVVCVLHHIVHLMMDSFLVGKIANLK